MHWADWPTVFLCDIFQFSTPSCNSILFSEVRLRSLYFSAIGWAVLSKWLVSSRAWYSLKCLRFSACLTVLLTYLHTFLMHIKTVSINSTSSLSSSGEIEIESKENHENHQVITDSTYYCEKEEEKGKRRKRRKWRRGRRGRWTNAPPFWKISSEYILLWMLCHIKNHMIFFPSWKHISVPQFSKHSIPCEQTYFSIILPSHYSTLTLCCPMLHPMSFISAVTKCTQRQLMKWPAYTAVKGFTVLHSNPHINIISILHIHVHKLKLLVWITWRCSWSCDIHTFDLVFVLLVQFTDILYQQLVPR